MTTPSEHTVTHRVDSAVISAATKLMAANLTTSPQISQDVLRDVVASFGVDEGFLRYNDHNIRATKLIAEWPPRPDTPAPDPLDVVYFDNADPLFAAGEHAKEPVFFQPDAPLTSLVAIPLLSGDVTTGTLNLVKFGIKDWTQQELNSLTAIASLFAQVQARIAVEKQLRYVTEHDDLTGLLNRRALLSQLDSRLHEDKPGPVAVLFFALDRLRAINDYLGQHVGDWFIQGFADRLRAETNDEDIIARLTGGEFVVIPGTPLEAEPAEKFAQRLQSMLSEQVAIGGETLTRTASIGIALGTPGHHSASDLVRQADQATLHSKKAGNNTITLLTDDTALRNKFRHQIELHLHNIAKTGGLLLNYLPEFDIRTGAVIGTEALVRWQHPTLGLLLPDSFINIAESINMIGELGRWVLRTACADFSQWRANGIDPNAMLRLNVSPVQLVTNGFVDTVADTITEFQLDPSAVCLEITETIVVQDIDTMRITIAELKDVGVRIAIDDFGTGHSVLTHLKSLPVDTLKIDQSFVRDLGVDPDDLAIIRAIVGLAEAFDLELVAEGVESEAAAMTLLQHGCYQAQGFLLSRPLSREAMEQLLLGKTTPVHFTRPTSAGP